jgi:hypothetical protein
MQVAVEFKASGDCCDRYIDLLSAACEASSLGGGWRWHLPGE